MLSGLIGVAALAIVGYAALCALLYFGQERSIFFPRPNDSRLLQQYQPGSVQITTPQSTLEGWWIENPRAATPGVILYFGGNAEDVLYTATLAPRFEARRMLVVNYRGYGRSTGAPGQQALYDDALAIYDYVVKSGVEPQHIVVMGRSLGSGVASMLAAQRPVRAAVLITPFDSLAAVAAGHYPIFPVRLLLRHPFPSADWAKQTQAPALILAAQRDFVVPASHAQRLHDAWAGTKQMHVLDGTGHNDIELHPRYYALINEFLEDVLGGDSS
jgi:uncharacterized protein